MISVLFPVYNEEESLYPLYERLAAVTANISDEEFEFLFVDDCSSDRTPEILREMHEQDRRVKIMRFARNCGSHAAISAGLHHCSGHSAIVLAADLQDPPELIAELRSKWQSGAKTVWGIRSKRPGEKIKTRLLARLYYFFISWLTKVKLPPTGSDVFLADRDVIEAYKKMGEKHISVFMALAWLGFKQDSVAYIKAARTQGYSKWTFGKKMKLAVDSILAFSDVPIRYMSILGFITALCGFIYAVYVLWSVLNGNPVEGWSSLMVAVLVIGGVQMMMIGTLGEYLWRTFDESRKRPMYVIESILD